MKKFLGLALVLMLMGCKAKALLAAGKASEAMPAETIVRNHYLGAKDFSTVYIKASAKYKDDDNSQNVQADIKIKKDEKILVSVRVLGITMAKALITPDAVKYYEKINGEYFEGDYTTLSAWLGTDLDFQKVQNLLIGRALDDLTKGQYAVSIEDKLYKLSSTAGGTDKAYFFEAERFLIKKETIGQPAKNRSLEVSYPNHTQHPQMILPTDIAIAATQKKGQANIDITYNTVTFNEDLSFPYSVPEGYDRIYID
jgi:hypothetical protein